ncbi:cilia- and flagella-associated protein 157-like [Channa argus]|uniref:cilia- and flagella-associated protein 157-like n=1 Tax=Channa argus TaxID=215402 RepID=UPI003521B8C2
MAFLLCRCQLKCDELEEKNKDFTSQYTALEKDKKNITAILKLSVAAKEKKVDNLVKLLENQQQTAEKEREVLELQHSQQKQTLEEQIDKINSENMIYGETENCKNMLNAMCKIYNGMVLPSTIVASVVLPSVAKIEELKEQLVQLMEQLQDLESAKQRLVSQKEEYDAAIHLLKNENEWKKAKMLEDMRDRMDNLLKAKILDVIEEERAHYGKCMEQVHFLQSDSMLLLKENDALHNRNRDLCAQSDNLKEEFDKIKQMMICGRKEVVQLSENCQQVKAEVEDWRITHQDKLAQIKGFRLNVHPFPLLMPKLHTHQSARTLVNNKPTVELSSV